MHLTGCTTTTNTLHIHQMELPIPPEHTQAVKECMVPALDSSIGHMPLQLTTSERHNPFTIFSKSALARVFYSHHSQPTTDVNGGTGHPVLRVAFNAEEIRILIQQFSASLGHVLWMKPDLLLQDLRRRGVDKKALSKQQIEYIKAYLEAYFGEEHLVFLELNASHPEHWETQIKTQLDAVHPDDISVRGLRIQLERQLLNGDEHQKYFHNRQHFHVLVNVGGYGFISRSGVRYQFPGLSGGLSFIDSTPVTATHVDYTQVGADIIRIVLEALRDASAPLPAVANATGVKHGLSVYDPNDNNSDWNMSEPGFLAAETRGNRAESLVGTAVGQLIRGGSWGALNNEAVAKLAETLAGVIARHIAERLEWCISKSSQRK